MSSSTGDDWLAARPLRTYGVNVQVLADTRCRLLWASAALPGAVHDVKAARLHGIPTTLAKFGVASYADAAYQGAGPVVAVPVRRRPRRLSAARRQSTATTWGRIGGGPP